MADPPDFTADPFNFEKEVWESYRRFIERLRNQVGVRFSHNRAVTPDEVNPPTRFFDLVLQTNDHNIIVRFRRDNLYLIGYQMQGTGQWLELRHDNYPVRRIAGSTFLNFGDTYANLIGAAGVTEITQINVGRQELIGAINMLAVSRDDRVRAQSLLVLLVMICESLRFTRITDHFTTHRTTELIPAWIDTFRRGWNTISESLLHVDADAHFRFPPENNFQVYTVEAAVGIIGVLKGHFFGPGPGPRPGGRPRRSIDDEGRPLVEIFSVTINNIDGDTNTRGDIYGTIKFSDGLNTNQYIYNRETNGSESVHTKETVLLNGPTRCITAYDDFIFNVDLKSKEWLSEDDQVSKGEISWYVTNITTNEYDKLLRRQVNGQNGSSATVNYAVLSNAVEATIEVSLTDPYGGDPIDVYGQIDAQNSNFDIAKSVLFRKADNKYINVKPGEVIPLSRSVVAVPMNSKLIVRADLKESNNFSPDDEIANGKATFTPHPSGTYEENISNSVSPTRYRIKVKVTWDWYVV